MVRVCGESNPSQPSSPLHHQIMCLLLKNRTSTSTKVKKNRKLNKKVIQGNANRLLANSMDCIVNKFEHVGEGRGSCRVRSKLNKLNMSGGWRLGPCTEEVEAGAHRTRGQCPVCRSGLCTDRHD